MLSLAERPALCEVPLGVVPFVVAEGMVRFARRNKSGHEDWCQRSQFFWCLGQCSLESNRVGGGEKKVDLHQTRRDGSAETKPQASRNWTMADGGEQTVVKGKSSVNRVQCSVVRYMTEQEQARAIRSVNSSCSLDVVELKVQQVRSPVLGVGAAAGC